MSTLACIAVPVHPPLLLRSPDSFGRREEEGRCAALWKLEERSTSMSQNKSATRNSASPQDHGSSSTENFRKPQQQQQQQQFSGYVAGTTASSPTTAPVSTNTSFASQNSTISGPSTTVGSPGPTTSSVSTRPRDKGALDVNTILNPSPQRPRRPRVAPYNASRRPSLTQYSSPQSPSGPSLGGGGGGGGHRPLQSPAPSPVEIGGDAETTATYHGISASALRRAPSVPTLTSPGPLRAQPRRSLPVINAQTHPFPRLSSPRDSPAAHLEALNTPPPSSLPPPSPAPQQPQTQQQQQQQQQQQFQGASYAPLGYAPGYTMGTPHSSATASPLPAYGGFSSAPGFAAHPAVTQPIYHAQMQQTLGGSMIQHVGHYGMGMALELPGGHGFVPVSLDTESGGKLRSEKRRKNAEASNRFRKRKKEREVQTSRRVAELEQKLKKAEDERSYYQRERNFFHNIIVQARQNGGRLPPLPPEMFHPENEENSVFGERGGGVEEERHRHDRAAADAGRLGSTAGLPAPLGTRGGLEFAPPPPSLPPPQPPGTLGSSSSGGGPRLPPQSPRTGNFTAPTPQFHHHQQQQHNQYDQQQPQQHQLQQPPHSSSSSSSIDQQQQPQYQQQQTHHLPPLQSHIPHHSQANYAIHQQEPQPPPPRRGRGGRGRGRSA